MFVVRKITQALCPGSTGSQNGDNCRDSSDLETGASESENYDADFLEQIRICIERCMSSDERAELIHKFQTSASLSLDLHIGPLLETHNAFVTSVRNGELRTVTQIVNHGTIQINTPLDDSGLTLMYLAAIFKQTDIISWLLQNPEVEVNPITRDGETPLHFALKAPYGNSVDTDSACANTVKIIANDRRCNVGRVNAAGVTALMVAVGKGMLSIVQTLTAPDRIYMHTPADLAAAIKLAFVYDRNQPACIILNSMGPALKEQVVSLLKRDQTSNQMDINVLLSHNQDLSDNLQPQVTQRKDEEDSDLDSLPSLSPQLKQKFRKSFRPNSRGYSSSSRDSIISTASSITSWSYLDELKIIARDDLKVGRKLGEGGFGCVTAGTWLGTPCAIKQVRPFVTSDMNYDEILKEARIQYQLRHPNIITLFGISYEQDLWMVMQLVDGMDLHALLFGRNKERVTNRYKLQIAVQATHAISYLHEKGFLHNDIKPENIMIERKSGNVLLCDFGITRFLGKGNVHTQKYTDAMAGTRHYVATECFQKDPVKQRYRRPTFMSDIWALSAVFIEMFTEKELFPTEKALLECKIMGDYSRIKALLKEMEDKVVRKLMKRGIDQEPRIRPTAEDMNTVLFEIMKRR